MTTKVDQQRRAVLPFEPGDLLAVEKHSQDVVVLKRMKPPQHLRPKLVRIKGELFSARGEPLSSEEVRHLLEDEA